MKSRSNHDAPMSRRRKFTRTFKGYVALQREGGPIIWGSLNRDAAATRQFFLHHNPTQTPVIRAVRITFDDHPPA